MKVAEKARNCVVSLTEKMLKQNANSTTCIYVYQPKAPKGLEKFSKLKNDK